MRVHAVHRLHVVVVQRRELRAGGRADERRRDEGVEVLPGRDLDVPQAALLAFVLLVEAVVGPRLEVGEHQRVAAPVDDDRRFFVQPPGRLDLARAEPDAGVIEPRARVGQALPRLQGAEAQGAVDIQVHPVGGGRDGQVLQDRPLLRTVGDQVDTARRRNARAVGEQPLRDGLCDRRRRPRRVRRREAHAAQVVLDGEATVRVGVGDLQRTPEVQRVMGGDAPVLRGGVAVRADHRQRGGGLFGGRRSGDQSFLLQRRAAVRRQCRRRHERRARRARRERGAGRVDAHQRHRIVDAAPGRIEGRIVAEADDEATVFRSDVRLGDYQAVDQSFSSSSSARSAIPPPFDAPAAITRVFLRSKRLPPFAPK